MRGSECTGCGVDFYPNGISHVHCNREKCRAELPLDNNDQDVINGRVVVIPGSSKGFKCKGCDEFSCTDCGANGYCQPCLQFIAKEILAKQGAV